jgi:hypothetical protein
MSTKGFRLASVLLLFCITILLLATIFLVHYGPADETKYVDTNDFQAVDINVGGSSSSDQIYFGHVKALNSNFVVLDDVYYIPTTSTSSSITLEPLICQVDAPFNQMVVSRSSVNWWENLQPTGKVATTITSYQKNNPNGPTCPSSSTSSTSGTSSTAATTTPSSTTTTK